MIQKMAHETAKANGFWESERNPSELLMLIVTELAEVCEALRHGDPKSTVIPFSSVAEELADAVIRIADMAQGLGIPLSEAILAKLEYNKKRPYKHGKHF
jgi:NTP pyrophosphatase (non-canonical NTP hydrolase)